MAIAVFLAVCVVILRWLWSYAFLVESHADTVETLFWAEAARESGNLFGTTFHYPYFIPFGGNLLVRPFLSVFGMDLAAHRAGMSLFVPILAFACFRLFRSFRWKRWESILVTALLFSVASASPKMREIYFGHVIYYSLATVFLFLGCAQAPDLLEAEGRPLRARIVSGATFALVLGWASSCGKPLLLYVVVPVLGSWGVVRLSRRERLSPLRDGLRILPGAIGAVVGLLAFHVVSRTIPTASFYGEYYELFSPIDSWFQNIKVLPQEWISLLDPLPRARIAIAGRAGLPHAFRIAAAIALCVTPVAALFRIRSFSQRERMFVVAHWILAAEILFYWLFGNISNANWRLAPLILSATVVSACLVRNTLASRSIPVRRFAVCAATFLFGFLFLSMVQTYMLPGDASAWRESGTLLPTLEQIGIRDGYCSDYWYANWTTAVSGNRFRLREVRIGRGGKWTPRLFNSDSRWYEPDASRTNTVFVCHPREEDNAPKSGLVGRFPCWQRTGRAGPSKKLVVLVYDGDCFHPQD